MKHVFYHDNDDEYTTQEGFYDNPPMSLFYLQNLETKAIEYLLKQDISIHINVQRDGSGMLPFATSSEVLRLKDKV